MATTKSTPEKMTQRLFQEKACALRAQSTVINRNGASFNH
jgi:hypothetical protein